MRWWLQTDPPSLMSVDNASVSGMDFSALLATDPDLWMVQWTDGKGEIERQDVDNNANLIGLREGFYDITPYARLFQQFLSKVPGLLLDQAKKIQIDLIKHLFEAKRQMPFHYPIAAGDYWWDASDDAMFAPTSAQLQNATAAINAIAARLNSVIPGLNSVDASIVSQSNVNVPTHNAFLDAVTNGIYVPLYYFVEHFNSVLGYHDYDHLEYNTINNRLVRRTDYPNEAGTQGSAGLPGIVGDLPQYSNSVAGPGSNYFVNISYGGGVPWTPLPNVTGANASWIPIGGTTPVNVTPAEQAAIMQGIAARTNSLNLIKNSKIAEVNALTYVGAVIAYDVLAGWPVMVSPPGFKLEAPVAVSGGGVTLVGTPPAPGAGIPEAPNDGVTYGRHNMAWNPALALSGDILDGGNF